MMQNIPTQHYWNICMNKTELLKSLLSNTKFDVFNNAGFLKLNETTTAKVTLEISGVCDHYTRLLVKIINKNEGVVDDNSFLFKDLTHDISLHQNSDSTRNLYIWSHRDSIEWYIDKPTKKSVDKMNSEINHYLSFFE